MRLNKRERNYVLILLVASVALAVDRLLLPRPNTAIASAGASFGDGLPPLEKLRAALEMPPPPTSTSTPERNVADVFAWSRVMGTLAPSRTSPNPQLSPADAFRANHTLRGTILGPEPLAIVGRRPMRIGDELDGFRLERIAEAEARFVSDAQSVVTLRVPSRQNSSDHRKRSQN